MSVTPTADFTPSGERLDVNQRSLANYLQRSWDLGSTEEMAAAFRRLSGMTDGDSCRSALDQCCAAWFTTNAIQRTFASSDALGSTMSCPVFEQEGLLGEAGCVWGKITAGTNRQSASSGTPPYKFEGVEYRLGRLERGGRWMVRGRYDCL